MGYRDALYDQYVTGHQGVVPESRSQAALQRDIVSRIPHDAAPILDVGCGQGQLLRLLLAEGHSDVMGIDTSAEQVELASRLGTPYVHEANVLEFARENEGRFGCVVAVDLIEHFDRDNVLPLFNALRAMLRPGGRLIVRTPNGVSPFHGRILFGDLTHGVAYTHRMLEQIAARTGFASVTSYPCRPAGTRVKTLARRALWRLIEMLVTVALIAETGVVRGHIVTQNLVAVLTAPGTT
jgi:2-polyprenyl-3-methyl-5-hydroxy-6-metoxy-1,4-benzoquinol methylase